MEYFPKMCDVREANGFRTSRAKPAPRCDGHAYPPDRRRAGERSARTLVEAISILNMERDVYKLDCLLR